MRPGARYMTAVRWYSFVAIPTAFVMVAWNAGTWFTWLISIPIWTGAYEMILLFTYRYGGLQMMQKMADAHREQWKKMAAEQLEQDQIRWNAQLVALQDLAVLMIKYGIDPEELRPIVERGFAP
jgi:hypothetical protein